jgi:hypothetical protein
MTKDRKPGKVDTAETAEKLKLALRKKDPMIAAAIDSGKLIILGMKS